jgi:hypothetical protein
VVGNNDYTGSLAGLRALEHWYGPSLFGFITSSSKFLPAKYALVQPPMSLNVGIDINKYIYIINGPGSFKLFHITLIS